MAEGTVKRVVWDRGFGFITGEDGKDYFFHRDALAPGLELERLAEGARVQFDSQSSARGPRAINVRALA